MHDARPDAAYGARLLAFALSTSALIGLVTTWAYRRAIASLASSEGFLGEAVRVRRPARQRRGSPASCCSRASSSSAPAATAAAWETA